MSVKFGDAKFQPLRTPRGTFSNWGLYAQRVGKMCIFLQKTDHILETVRDTA